VAKASAPFAPAFATTLAVLTTDASAGRGVLETALTRTVARSFERVLVDQHPGIGDAVVLLANGTAAAPPLVEGSEGAAAFEAALGHLCESLAEGLAMRVPGTRKLLVVTVHGAASHADALAAARAVAGSVALRVALAAGVAAWPAVLDALGGLSAGVALAPARVGIRFGPVTVVAGGRLAPHDEGAAAAVAAKSQVDLAVDLGTGGAAATVTTTDLPADALEAMAVPVVPEPEPAGELAAPEAPSALAGGEDQPPDPPDPSPDLAALDADPDGTA
jgi:glutamate N-acetyltransferase/amino-acid N-acetyltransferase